MDLVTHKKKERATRNSHSQWWMWSALFIVLLLGFFAIGLFISERGLLSRWLGQEVAAFPPDQAQVHAGQSQQGQSDGDGRAESAKSAVVGVVNGQVITQYDLDLAIAVGRVFYRAARGQPPGSIDEAGAVRQLADDALIQQAAEAAGITVTDREVTRFLEQLKAGQNISDQALATAMEAEGLTMEELRAEIRRVATNDKFMRQQVLANVPADQVETARTNWLNQQRAQADIQVQQIAAAEPVASLGVPVVGALAPDFTLTDLEGEEVTMSDLQGQSVLLYFWTTWCPPCQAELPAIDAIYQKYKEHGLRVLAVDVQEQPALVQDFTQQSAVSFLPVLDETGAVARRYRVRGLPTSFYVNREGTITAVQVGATPPQEIEALATAAMVNTQTPEQIAAADQDHDHADAEVHWHVRLRIIVFGREEQLFNLEKKQFFDIHHPNLTLGEALATYQIDYAEDCILDTCREQERRGTLTVRINGEEVDDFESYILKDGDEVVMELR